MDELPSEWVAEFNRNGWPNSIGTGGRIQSERVAEFNRNGWPNWIGTGGRFASESVAELARNTHIPAPKLGIASAACAIGGRPLGGSPEVNNGSGGLLPVDQHVPGCPPHPHTRLDGLIRLPGRR
ncbi:MAG: hypothetical protein K0A93_05660 [Desulfuromonadaceae bacterium]|nr:hypothetical protein [Desulfuromonadaceae bacterium]